MTATRTPSARIGMFAGAFAAAMLIAFLTLALSTSPALAYLAYQDAGSWKSSKETIMLDNKGSAYVSYPNEIDVYDTTGSKKITNVKTTNSKVASIENFGTDGFNITLKKPGKATVSYKCNGKTYKHQLTLVKYQNPVKTFKVGSKNFASKLKKYPGAKASVSLAKQKITVKAASGWKLDKNLIVTTSKGEKKVKVGKALPKNTVTVTANLTNKKTGVVKPVSLYDPTAEIG